MTKTLDSLLGFMLYLKALSDIDDFILKLSMDLFLFDNYELEALNFLEGAGDHDPTALGSYSFQ